MVNLYFWRKSAKDQELAANEESKQASFDEPSATGQSNVGNGAKKHRKRGSTFKTIKTSMRDAFGTTKHKKAQSPSTPKSISASNPVVAPRAPVAPATAHTTTVYATEPESVLPQASPDREDVSVGVLAFDDEVEEQEELKTLVPFRSSSTEPAPPARLSSVERLNSRESIIAPESRASDTTRRPSFGNPRTPSPINENERERLPSRSHGPSSRSPSPAQRPPSRSPSPAYNGRPSLGSSQIMMAPEHAWPMEQRYAPDPFMVPQFPTSVPQHAMPRPGSYYPMPQERHLNLDRRARSDPNILARGSFYDSHPMPAATAVPMGSYPMVYPVSPPMVIPAMVPAMAPVGGRYPGGGFYSTPPQSVYVSSQPSPISTANSWDGDLEYALRLSLQDTCRPSPIELANEHALQAALRQSLSPADGIVASGIASRDFELSATTTAAADKPPLSRPAGGRALSRAPSGINAPSAEAVAPGAMHTLRKENSFTTKVVHRIAYEA